jgi:hypothetical protein
MGYGWEKSLEFVVCSWDGGMVVYCLRKGESTVFCFENTGGKYGEFLYCCLYQRIMRGV